MPILLYDGACALCQAAVRLVLRHDRDERFRFASQRSELGRRLLAAHGLATAEGETLVLLDDGRAFLRSEAAVRIAERLSGPLRWAALLRVVPRPVRDAVYDAVARLRGLAGRPAACPVDPAVRRRFLDADGGLGRMLTPVATPAPHRSPG